MIPGMNYRWLPVLIAVILPVAGPDAVALPPDEEERVARARETRFPHYADRLAAFLRETPEVEPGGIVFLGDSITEAFPAAKAFPGQNVLNRGIGGDRIGGVLERLDVSVSRPQPRRVFLMIGINDIVGTPNVPVASLAGEYGRLLDQLREAAPEAEIVVQYLLPLSGGFAVHNERVREMNVEIRRLAEERGLPFLDLHWHLRDESGALRREFTFDGIHLTLMGYWAWLESFFTPVELAEASAGFAPPWIDLHQTTRRATRVDPGGSSPFPGHRGVDELIVFTSDHGKASTGTNPWGFEAVVDNGVVIRSGGNNSTIPPGGFVVSGHGLAARWISLHLRPGARVTVADGMVSIKAEAPATPRDRLNHLRTETFRAVLRWTESGRVAGDSPELRQILGDLRRLGAPGAGPDAENLDRLEERVKAFAAAAES